LARLARRLSQDWQTRYGHPIYLLECFVQHERFEATCYKAANWHRVGTTKGRSRRFGVNCQMFRCDPIPNLICEQELQVFQGEALGKLFFAEHIFGQG
jgi:hypothetical protein